MTYYDTNKTYIKYVEDVISGKVITSSHIRLACERFKSWFGRDDIYFDYTDVDKRIKLVSKLKHSAGKCAHQPFILLPYQQWLYAGIFGWRNQDHKRVCKNALLFMARKSGKTAFAASIAVTQLLLEGDGQEFDFIANSGAQARIGFEHTKNYAESVDPKRLLFKRFRDSIKMPCKKSVIDVLNSDSMTLDGRSSSTFVFDELHAAKNWDLYNVMKSSQGFQSEPLAIVITTAGFLLDGFPLYEMRKNAIEILKGTKSDDSQFIALYELDPEDDPFNDESCWIKSNPSLGQTVTVDYLRDQVTMAKNQPSLEYGVKTKNFNMFCQSTEVWLPSDTIKNTMQHVDTADYKGEWCYAGVDLAAVSDLTCHTVLFPPNPTRKVNPDKFVFKTLIYLPESCLSDSINKTLYQRWAKTGQIIPTPGNVTDYDYILKDQTEIIPISQYASIAYDSWNSTQWAIDATNAGLPLTPYSQALGNFNKPTKYLEMLIKQGKVIIDTNECVLWCFNNVVLKFDYNANCKPDKPTREAKIDPVISMCEALGTYLDNNLIDLNIT